MGFNCLANFSRVTNIIDQLIAFSKISFSLVGKKKITCCSWRKNFWRDGQREQQDGIGNMKITPSGIQLNGEAMVLDTLITSHISAKQGQPLVFDSSQNITMNARDAQGRIANKIFLGKLPLPNFFRFFKFWYIKSYVQ